MKPTDVTPGAVIELFRRGDFLPSEWFEFTSANSEYTPIITATFNAAAAVEMIDGVRWVRQLRHPDIGVPFIYFNLPIDDERYEGGTIEFKPHTEFIALSDDEILNDAYF